MISKVQAVKSFSGSCPMTSAVHHGVRPVHRVLTTKPNRGEYQTTHSALEGLQRCLDNNKRWAAEKVAQDREYFARWAEGQSPEFLFIGCSDSRVVANDVLGMKSGDVFVHRNVGNVVSLSDINCMSVLEYSVGALKVKHIIVCGHYGCGACKAAQSLPLETTGFVNGWISNIRSVGEKWKIPLHLASEDKKANLLVELNALEQTRHVCLSQAVQAAWSRGQELYVHTVVYDIATGHLKILAPGIDSTQKLLTVDLVEDGCVLKAENLKQALLEGIGLTHD